MTIYKVFWQQASRGDGDDGRMLSWQPSMRAAKSRLAELRRNGDVHASGPHGIEPVCITPTKSGLLGWLNVAFTSDNG